MLASDMRFSVRARAATGRCWRPTTDRKLQRVMRCVAQADPANTMAPGSVLPNMSTSSRSSRWQLAVLGDLHLPPDRMQLHMEARRQLRGRLRGPDADDEGGSGTGCEWGGSEGRVVQLGDLGSGKHAPGSTACFQFARQYLEGFGVPYSLVTGNHDLEGEEFESDEENLEAWRQVFSQPPYWAADLGVARLVGLSSVRYRSNVNSHHEVFIPAEQLAWLEGQLQQHPTTPFIVATHAPPMGCGLKVIQEVHIKNRCAWLNHSARSPPDPDPRVFLSLVSRYPGRIKLWFSGHFHLSHNYPDSISVVGGTAFVQVGVIGECNRDGMRQSRLLRGSPSGYQLLTLDHDTGATRLDLQAGWADPQPPAPLLPPEEELLCDPEAGWLCSQLECKMGDNSSVYMQWYPVGSEAILALQAGGLLVEYDMATAAPIGLVTRLPPGASLELAAGGGGRPQRGDGADVEQLRVLGQQAAAAALQVSCWRPYPATPPAPSSASTSPTSGG